MRSTKTILGIAAILLAGMSTNLLAQGRGMRGGAMNARGPFAQLELTDAQRQKVEPLRETAKKQSEPLRMAMQTKHTELQQLWTVDRPDKSAIERKQAEIASLHQKIQTIQTDLHLQVHAILTPEQRAKWAANMGRGPGKGGRDGKGRGFMHGGGMGGGDPVNCPYNQK
jgi:Spy/CpxP family protein refolding chaperone